MKRLLIIFAITFGFILSAKQSVFAANDGSGHATDTTVLIGIAVILFAAKLFGEICEKLGQPAVLGELIAGIVLGNLFLFGFNAAEPLKANAAIETLAQLGIIILLFEVGLETNLKEMKQVGASSLLVAVVGVIAPFVLGWGAAKFFLGNQAMLSHIFIGAMLCATSIGITARVLRDMGRLNDREAHIILGAAVIDDVLALLVLAIVEGAIEAEATGANLEISVFIIIALKAIAFIVGAILVGQFVVPKIFRSLQSFESHGFVLGLSIAICFFFAWASAKMGLAAIIGAFAAGVILDEASFKHFIDHEKHDLADFLEPISAILAPVFFVSIGLKVDLRAFGQPELLGFAAVLTLAAIIGKQACAFGATEKGLNRKAIGIGMVPRGEVVLFFASVGATLTLPNALGVNESVISRSTFSAVVIMVIVTTLITPLALKWSLGRKKIEATEKPVS